MLSGIVGLGFSKPDSISRRMAMATSRDFGCIAVRPPRGVMQKLHAKTGSVVPATAATMTATARLKHIDQGRQAGPVLFMLFPLQLDRRLLERISLWLCALALSAWQDLKAKFEVDHRRGELVEDFVIALKLRLAVNNL